MTVIRHGKITDPRIGDLLDAVEGTGITADPLSVEAVNIREWRRSYDRISKIPEDLAKALSHAASEGQSVWERARPADDWELFKPKLERLVDLKREQAEALGYQAEPYDALLDDYEPGAPAAEVAPILRRLAVALTDLVRRIREASAGPRSRRNDLRFPVKDQAAFAAEVARELGYDLDGGRLDVSAHPFTSGIGPGDVRITSRYREDDFSEGFFAVVHEAGHAMYHQGLPLEHWGVPFCRPVSLGINESQSRMWENMVARSRGFWEHFHPRARKIFPCLDSVPVDDFLAAMNRVEPSLIRVDADEVTYNLHVLVRFELETALMSRELEVDDLPDAWNEMMNKYLGVAPSNYADGVMQDTHWAGGAIGYFPTYTLGNLYAAQFYAQAEKELGDLHKYFARGEFSPLLQWLRKKIHSMGSRYVAKDLVRVVTGEDLNPRYAVDYLERKYSALYGL
jgi:carboxypeptidase Taq